MAPRRLRTEHRNISPEALLRIETATATVIGTLDTTVAREEGAEQEQGGQDERLLGVRHRCGSFDLCSVLILSLFSSVVFILNVCFVFFYSFRLSFIRGFMSLSLLFSLASVVSPVFHKLT